MTVVVGLATYNKKDCNTDAKALSHTHTHTQILL